jgi:hypothetical protein
MPSSGIKTKPVRTTSRPRNLPKTTAPEEIPSTEYYITKLCSVFPGRGSCTLALEKAADYVLQVFQQSGMDKVEKEPFKGDPSTYRPYALAFSAAAIGSVVAVISQSALALLIAALLCDLAIAGLLAETNFSSTWMDWFLPKGNGINISGCVPGSKGNKKNVLIAGHLDTHRTPIFFSSPAWQKRFLRIMMTAYSSLLAAFLFYGLGLMLVWSWVRWPAVILGLFQLGVAYLCWQADRTPFSPGANDNTSGAALTIRLAQLTAKSPLENTRVWFLIDDCEETGSAGMIRFLESHKDQIGRDCLVFTPDEIGNKNLICITEDGLLIKHKGSPGIIAVAEKAAAAVEGFSVRAAPGMAYTDATAATHLKYPAISLVSIPDEGEPSHWHQTSDLPQYIQPESLLHAETFLLKILEQVDQAQNPD